MSATGKLYFVSIEVLASKEGIDLPRFLQKINGLLEDYSTATHVIYKFKVRGLPTFPISSSQHFPPPRFVRMVPARSDFVWLRRFFGVGNAESNPVYKPIVRHIEVFIYAAISIDIFGSILHLVKSKQTHTCHICKFIRSTVQFWLTRRQRMPH